jgi:predicted nucleic acid-binding protein
VLTFVDSGMLIAAARRRTPVAGRALTVLDDPARTFASSVFVQLEVLPKATYFRQTAEVRFYQSFFNDRVSVWAEPLDDVVRQALTVAATFGLSAMDALHVAAALVVGAVEFVTTEGPDKPIHRATGLGVTAIYRG